MYTKDITFLLRLLQASKQSGTLFVEPPGQHASSWQGQFQLDQGMVISCLIVNKTHGYVLLSSDEALRWLTSQGKLDWRLEEDTQPTDPFQPLLSAREEANSGQPPDEDRLLRALWSNQLGDVPQLTQKGKSVSVNAFSTHEYRQVFALIDGRRTIEEIVYLLHKSPDSIFRVLQELRAAGLVL